MKIEMFPMEGKSDVPGAVGGTIKLPVGAKIVHVGAAPPRGEMYAYAEVSPVKVPDKTLDVAILQVGQTIPNGYVYMGYILAIPILFVYRKKDNAIIT